MKKYSNGITMSAFGGGYDYTISVFNKGHFLTEFKLCSKPTDRDFDYIYRTFGYDAL